MMQAAWTFDSQWSALILCGVAAAICVILAGWQSSRAGLRSALRGCLFAGIYTLLILFLRFGLHSYLDEAWLVWIILISAFYVPLHTGICALKHGVINKNLGGSQQKAHN